MAAAGLAWGVYSLLGKGSSDPVADTARNFVLAAPMSIGLLMATQKMSGDANWDGITYALVSGAITSGLGYVIWYVALRHITSVPAAIAQLTVPVFRGREAVSRQIRGTGLGLSLVSRVMRAHGGSVQVDSTPGQGTCFTLRLPAAPAAGLPA
jgi:hypothetical protein